MKKMTHLLTLSAVVSALLLMLSPAAVVYADPFPIDSFDNGGESLTVNSGWDGFPTSASAVYNGSGIVGGQRDTVLTWKSGTTGYASMTIDANNSNIFNYSSDPGMAAELAVTWDGPDNNATALDPIGLRVDGQGVNLTGTPNDGLHLSMIFDDLRANLIFKVYTDGSNWSQYTLNLPGALDGSPARMDAVLPFTAFTVGGGSGATFSNVGAIVMVLDGTVTAGVDVQVDFVNSDGRREYGDLPLSVYGANVLNANHVPKGLRLGFNVDAESTANESLDAAGDDGHQYAPDDEDGVAPYLASPWTEGGIGSVILVVSGCPPSTFCFVNGWIDWNKDGKFENEPGQAPEQILTNHATGNTELGLSSPFMIPTSYSDDYYYARFRICRTMIACNSPTVANVDNGEVEDYRWWLGPTGVDLASFAAMGRSGAVNLEWVTATESDLMGFNLWRNVDAGDPGTQLNAALIEANTAGSPFGSDYGYLDEGLVNGTTYYYWLESVHVGDVRTWHGPVSARPSFRAYLPLVVRQ